MAGPCGSATSGAAAPDPVERTVDPLGLVLKGGMWYVIAATDGQIRTYRASRVLDATLLDDRVERPVGFDLAAYWQESSAAYERDVPTVEVTVRVPADRHGGSPTPWVRRPWMRPSGSTNPIPTAGSISG